ncbi:unnamed protein product [Meganyctiphanes norvegica]|uniref:RGS domain-containing protein n=1 Tax=Meganyctiphanes norvegica TaxID=48144 RepID=A0AAV2RZV8_MEGNR
MVSREQRLKWKSSVSSLLSDPIGLQTFKDFIEKQKNEVKTLHCLEFYEQVEKHKKLSKMEELKKSSQTIYDTFLDDIADKEIPAIGGNKSREISKKLENEKITTQELKCLFDGAQETVIQFLSTSGGYKLFCKELSVGPAKKCVLL